MCVTRFCRIVPKITDGEKEYLPGDEVSVEGEKIILAYEAEIIGLTEKPEVFLIKNGQKKVLEVTRTDTGSYHVAQQVPFGEKQWEWLRLEVRKKDGTFLGYVNPVYYGACNSKCSTIEDVWKKMGEC